MSLQLDNNIFNKHNESLEKDVIIDEIQQLQNKILKLEQIRKQKILDEENAKKYSFEYYFQNLFDFIQMKKDREINRNGIQENGQHFFSSTENQRIKSAKDQNAELVPALENIYNALNIINKRLLKLEENI